MGQSEGSIFMMNLLDEQSLDKIMESAGTRLWKSFVIFGSASVAGSSRIHNCTAHQTNHRLVIHGCPVLYGCGIHLLGIVWSSTFSPP